MKLLESGLWSPDFCVDEGPAKWNPDTYQEGFVTDLIDFFVPIDRRSTCLDLGSNIGLTCLKFSEYFDNVYGFEPDPLIFECLSKNTESKSNIQVYNYAIDSKAQTAGFRRYSSSGFSQLIKRIPNEVNDKFLIVETKTLYDFYFMGKVDLIKIDVEGRESNILFSHKEFVLQYKPLMVVEIKIGNEGTTERKIYNKFNEFMDSIGYVLYYRRRKDHCYVHKTQLHSVVRHLNLGWGKRVENLL